MDPTRFIQSRWGLYEGAVGLAAWKTGSGKDLVFRRVTDLSLTLHQVAGHPVGLVRMPPPEAPLQAFFVAVVLLAPADAPERWPADARARLFTLEAEMDRPLGSEARGVLCERSTVGHRCIGMRVPAKPEPFLEAVGAVLLRAGNQPA